MNADTDNALAALLQAFAKRGELTAELESVDTQIATCRGQLAALRARDVADKERADKAAAEAAAKPVPSEHVAPVGSSLCKIPGCTCIPGCNCAACVDSRNRVADAAAAASKAPSQP